MIEKAGTGERTYTAVKTFLLADSDLRAGERIDIGDLSRRFGASASPIRAALHRMAGERLVVSHQGEGFSLPRVTEPGLSDLYQWNTALLANALRHPLMAPQAAELPDGHTDPISMIERIFALLATQSDNIEVEWAVAGVSDRLHRARRAELELVSDFDGEVEALRTALEGGEAPAMRQVIISYHRRRLRLVPAVVRRLHGLDDRTAR